MQSTCGDFQILQISKTIFQLAEQMIYSAFRQSTAVGCENKRKARMVQNKSIILGLAFALVSIPALAHHSRANFSDEVVAFEAEVTRWEWVNPHVYAYIEAPDADGVMTEWEVEMQSTMGLVRRGWSQDSLAVGEIITIRANPDKNPSRKLLFGITYAKDDGSLLSSQGSARGPADDVPPANSMVGVWSNASWGGAGPRDSAATHLPLTAKALMAAASYSEAQKIGRAHV